MLLPPTVEQRQIVAAKGRDRLGRIVRRWPERRSVALEQHKAHGIEAGLFHALPEARRHRAQILADEHASMPMGFYGEDGHHRRGVELYVGAMARIRALRYPTPPLDSHRVIKAQRPGMAPIGAQQFAP